MEYQAELNETAHRFYSVFQVLKVLPLVCFYNTVIRFFSSYCFTSADAIFQVTLSPGCKSLPIGVEKKKMKKQISKFSSPVQFRSISSLLCFKYFVRHFLNKQIFAHELSQSPPIFNFLTFLIPLLSQSFSNLK